MHAYLITAKPSRWLRAVRRVRACTARMAAGLLMVLVAVLVLVCRIPRPVINWIATGAANLELWLSIRLNLPPLGSLSGLALARAFLAEFRTAWQGGARTETTE
ncbi:hypothetical protein [Streptomyces sp. NPDC007063]|uniref:hypothetical protein n=1 Tax=Streptomyces sp. NPDC007063 TaxID=3364772 RepID=UPI0036C8B574